MMLKALAWQQAMRGNSKSARAGTLNGAWLCQVDSQPCLRAGCGTNSNYQL